MSVRLMVRGNDVGCFSLGLAVEVLCCAWLYLNADQLSNKCLIVQSSMNRKEDLISKSCVYFQLKFPSQDFQMIRTVQCIFHFCFKFVV